MLLIKKNCLRFLVSLLLLVCGSMLWAISPDDFNKITFINNLSGGQQIEYLFYSPGDSQYWGPDVLDKNHGLDKGKKQSFYIFYPDNNAVFDFMAIDAEGKVYELPNIEMIDGKERTVTVSDRNLTNKLLAKLPMAEVIVTNNTALSLDFAFFAPADSTIWGLEVLNSSRTMLSGEEVSFLVLLAGEHFDMEFMALGEDGTEYQKSISIGTSQETLHLELNEKDAVK